MMDCPAFHVPICMRERGKKTHVSIVHTSLENNPREQEIQGAKPPCGLVLEEREKGVIVNSENPLLFRVKERRKCIRGRRKFGG
jgi:hypothetical protein